MRTTDSTSPPLLAPPLDEPVQVACPPLEEPVPLDEPLPLDEPPPLDEPLTPEELPSPPPSRPTPLEPVVLLLQAATQTTRIEVHDENRT